MLGDIRLPARFWAHVTLNADGCWLWTGPLDSDGYAVFRFGPLTRAHRVAYVALVGAPPTGTELDHVRERGCRHRHCVNPAHMEPVTHAENMRRSAPATKFQCVNGHVYDALNTYIRPNGQRDCRKCITARQRVSRTRRRRAA